jgi:hypothetical protein
VPSQAAAGQRRGETCRRHVFTVVVTGVCQSGGVVPSQAAAGRRRGRRAGGTSLRWAWGRGGTVGHHARPGSAQGVFVARRVDVGGGAGDVGGLGDLGLELGAGGGEFGG